jgi:sodium-dependent dicarboxylate transporter 2/3/5
MDVQVAPTAGWRLAVGPLVAAIAYAACAAFDQPSALALTVSVTAWCAAWWILEPVHGAVTALLPLALFPLAGVLTPVQVAQAYGNELILLLAGGFMLAVALERCGAHRRLALGMVHAFGGGSGRRLVFGFAFATGFISMWISNTAATLMMLPVALAALADYPDRRVAAPLVLAIAYGASIGGMGTPIGTPPNVFFMQVYEQTTGTRMGFLEWMAFGVPAVLLFLPLCAAWLSRGLGDTPAASIPVMGPWQPAERRVLAVFGVVALAWITRTEPFGGWSGALGLKGANDAAVALLGVVAMCLVPDGKGGRLLTWDGAERIPWGALVLFGGGIALASAFDASGLSRLIAEDLAAWKGLALGSPWTLLLLMLAICASVTLLSEIASNTAAAVLLMPILATAAVAVGVEPALFMVPAVLAASCGFMLPVATAPNLVAYGTRQVTAQRMLREGAVMDLIGVMVLTAVCWVAFGL